MQHKAYLNLYLYSFKESKVSKSGAFIEHMINDYNIKSYKIWHLRYVFGMDDVQFKFCIQIDIIKFFHLGEKIYPKSMA